MSDIKAKNNHPDQAKEPFIGRFTSNVPLGPTLPSDITLTLDPSSAAAFIVKPKIWDGGIAHPDVTDAFIRAQLGASGFTLSQHSYHIGSFDILGMPSGPGTVMLRPGAPTSFTFNPSTGEFDAHYEGLMVNSLYPLSNPIVFLSDTSGIIQPDLTNVIEMTQDPWIVPGVPGKPALDKLGMAYIGTRAAFDPATGLLTFGDNVDLSAFPDVTVVRDPDGNYISTIGGSEQLVGASYSISPLHFLGRDSGQRYLFADAMFSVFDANGLLAQGKLTDIGIDPNSLLFTGDAFFDMIPGAASSPFLRNFQGGMGLFQFLGSEATLDLLASTDSFTVSGGSPSDFTNIHPTPEPATWLLLASGCLLWSRRPDRKGRRNSTGARSDRNR